MTAPNTSPGGGSRPGNRVLAAATAALAVALAAALATGTLHTPAPTPGLCPAGRVPVAMRDIDTARAYTMGDTVFVAPIKLWPTADSSALFSSILPNADSTGFLILPDLGRGFTPAIYCAQVASPYRAQIVSTMPDDTSQFPPPGAVH